MSTENAQPVDTAEYDGSCGYWYSDNWYPDDESAVDAWWNDTWDAATSDEERTREALLAAAGGDTFRRGKPLKLNAKSYAERVVDQMHENYFDGVDLHDDPDDPASSGPAFDALVAAIEALAGEFRPMVFQEGAPVDLTAMCTTVIDEALAEITEDA